MSMEFTARVAQILPEVGGTSKTGNAWRKLEVVFETPTNYGKMKRIVAAIWGDNIDRYQLVTGEMVTVNFDIESRDYNGRWYTEVKALSIRREGESAASSGPARPAAQAPGQRTPPVFTPPSDDDDLPF